MRTFTTLFGAVALFALAAADVTGELASSDDSDCATEVTSGSVTVTEYDCSATGECPDAALSIPTSTGTINALTVLVSALESFTARAESANALSVLSQAEATGSPPPSSFTFAPALYSSYGLTDVVPTTTTSSSSQTGSAPVVMSTASSAVSAPGPVVYSSITSVETTLVATTSTSASSASATEIIPVPVSYSTSGTVVVPVPVTSATAYTSSSASMTAPAGPESSTPTTLTTTTASASAYGSTTTASSESTSSTATGETANPVSATSSSVTAAAPTATNAGNKRDLPAAMGGLAVAAAALLFV